MPHKKTKRKHSEIWYAVKGNHNMGFGWVDYWASNAHKHLADNQKSMPEHKWKVVKVLVKEL